MVDYYSALLRAVTAPDAGDAQWRHAVYDRARQMLADRMRTRRPRALFDEAAAEQAALEAAIDRVEAELACADCRAVAAAPRSLDRSRYRRRSRCGRRLRLPGAARAKTAGPDKRSADP